MTTQTTGNDIDAWCSKCKLVLAHIITAMVGSKVTRVECKTCRAVHVYKAAEPQKKATTPKKARGGAHAPQALGPAEYAALLSKADLSKKQRYQTVLHYLEGDVIEHPSFELGVVTRLLADSKMEVLFPRGLTLLVHGRAARG